MVCGWGVKWMMIILGGTHLMIRQWRPTVGKIILEVLTMATWF